MQPGSKVDMLDQPGQVECGSLQIERPNPQAIALSQDAREYLLARHGTLDLNPMPNPTDEDPLNWPQWKKTFNIVLVALMAATSTLNAGSITPAYSAIAAALGKTLDECSYITTIQSLTLGFAPFIWNPISARYGRRPVWMLSLIGTLAGNIGCAVSTTYGAMMACRFIGAFFIAPASAIGTAVVAETFFQKERGKYLGIWTLLVTLGIPVGPIVMGAVTTHLGFRWIFWLLAIWNGVQLALAIPFNPETLYIRGSDPTPARSLSWRMRHPIRRIDPTPLTAWEFIAPSTLLRYATVLVPAVSYATLFVLANTALTTEIPDLMETKFDLNAQSLGLQFISVFVGTVLGEQFGGRLSDWWMQFGTHSSIPDSDDLVAPKKHRPAEWRLWIGYPGYLLAICGFVEFLVMLEKAPDGHWTVVPLIGIAIAAVGNQMVTTVMFTYAVDALPEHSAGVGVAINLVRQVWIFAGGFYLPVMFANVGVALSGAVGTAMIVGACIAPVAVLHWVRHRRYLRSVER